MGLGIGRPPPTPAEGLERPPNLIACGLQEGRRGGPSPASDVTPSASLILDRWFPPSPESSSSRPQCPGPSLSPFESPAPVLSPSAPCPPCFFLTRIARELAFSSLAPPPGQILQHWLNFAHSSVFLKDVFFKPFVLVFWQAQRSCNGYICERCPLSADQITPGS